MISRAQALEALTGERFDVAVIGGGITGAGAALDAATRGYSVALLEKNDAATLQHVEGVGEGSYEPLAHRYGHAAQEVLAIASGRAEAARFRAEAEAEGLVV